MKSARKDSLDPMDLHSYVSRRNAGNITHRLRIHAFEVKKHQLTVKRLQAANQLHQPFQRQLTVCNSVGRLRIRNGFDLRQAGPLPLVCPMFSTGMRDGRVMSHAVHPGPQRTALFIAFEAQPKSQVNLLKKVSLLVRVCLVSSDQTLQRMVVGCSGFLIEFVLPGCAFHLGS